MRRIHALWGCCLLSPVSDPKEAKSSASSARPSSFYMPARPLSHHELVVHYPVGHCQGPAVAVSPDTTNPPYDYPLLTRRDRDREAFIYSPPSFRKDAIRPRGRY